MKKNIITLWGVVVFWAIFMIVSFQSVEAAKDVDPALQPYLQLLEKQAKKDSASFQGFSASRGKQLYYQKNSHPKSPNQRSCETCHKDPKSLGETQVGKTIKALAPSVNSKRFVKVKKVKKWFRRNCKWTLQRKCTALEQGDFVYYMHSL